MDQEFTDRLDNLCPFGAEFEYKNNCVVVRKRVVGMQESEMPIILQACVKVIGVIKIVSRTHVRAYWGLSELQNSTFENFSVDDTVDTSNILFPSTELNRICTGNDPDKIMQSLEIEGTIGGSFKTILLTLYDLKWHTPQES